MRIDCLINYYSSAQQWGHKAQEEVEEEEDNVLFRGEEIVDAGDE